MQIALVNLTNVVILLKIFTFHRSESRKPLNISHRVNLGHIWGYRDIHFCIIADRNETEKDGPKSARVVMKSICLKSCRASEIWYQ